MKTLILAYNPSQKNDDAVLLNFVWRITKRHKYFHTSLLFIESDPQKELYTATLFKYARREKAKKTNVTIEELNQTFYIKFDLIITLGNSESYKDLLNAVSKTCVNIQWSCGNSALCRYLRISYYNSVAKRFSQDPLVPDWECVDTGASNFNLITEFSSLYWRFQYPLGSHLKVQEWSDIDILFYLTQGNNDQKILRAYIESESFWKYMLSRMTDLGLKAPKIGIIKHGNSDRIWTERLAYQCNRYLSQSIVRYADLEWNYYQVRLWLQEKSKMVVTNDIGTGVDSSLIGKATLQLRTDSWLYNRLLTHSRKFLYSPDILELNDTCLSKIKRMFNALNSGGELIRNSEHSLKRTILRILNKEQQGETIKNSYCDNQDYELYSVYQNKRIFDTETQSAKNMSFRLKVTFQHNKNKLQKLFYSPKTFIGDSFLVRKLKQSDMRFPWR